MRALSLTSHSLHEVRAKMPEIGAAIDRAAEEHHRRDRLRRERSPSG